MKKPDKKQSENCQDVKLCEMISSTKENPSSAKNGYKTYEINGPQGGFVMYCAGEGQSGGGQLVFDERGVSVLLKPEAAWRQATKAKRKSPNKLQDSEGNWSVWFLLSRVLVLNKRAMDACECGMGAADTIEEATFQLETMSKASNLASDARIHALPYVHFIEDEEALEIARSPQSFTRWFGAIIADKLASGDFEFVDSITGFVRAVHSLPECGYPDDVLMFRKVLAAQAAKVGGPPTKMSVRLALGVEEAKKNHKIRAGKAAQSAVIEEVSIWADRVGVQPDQRQKTPKMGGANDTFDEAMLKRLLERTGFGWLPKGQRQSGKEAVKFQMAAARRSGCR